MYQGNGPWFNGLLRKHEATVRRAIASGRSDSSIAAELDVTRHRARALIKYCKANPTEAAEQEPEETTLHEECPDVNGADWGSEWMADTGHLFSRQGAPIKTVDDLLRVAEVDLTKWQPYASEVSVWPTVMKVGPKADQSIVQVDNHRVWVKLERRWDLEGLRPQAPARPFLAPTIEQPDPMEAARILFVPDIQAGAYWNETHTELHPFQERRLLDAIVQAAALIQPRFIVLLGDNLDFATLSLKFPRPPKYRGTERASVLELHWWILQLRMACPGAVILYLEGNHEARLDKYLTEKAQELDGLMVPAGVAQPKHWVSYLLRLDDLGVEYVGPYGEDYYILDQIRVTHGTTVRSKPGHTMSAVIEKDHFSTVAGHIHSGEVVWRTVRGPEFLRQRKDIFGMSPGCACRVEPGVVPAMSRRMDWQQGCGTASVVVGAEVTSGHFHPYRDGVLYLEGYGPIHGRDRREEIAEFTGYPQIAGA